MDMVKKLIDENSELWEEIDPNKNQDVDCAELASSSTRKIWWCCRKNNKHQWMQTVRARSIQGYGCPYCSGRKTLPENSFASLNPELLLELDYGKNEDFDPYKYSKNSNKKVWWVCGNGHEWEATIHSRVVGSGCRECNKLKFTIPNKCPELLKEWHSKKNLPLTPDKVSCGSKEKIWWQCKNNQKHIWQVSVATRYHNKSSCPFCEKRKAIPNTRPVLGVFAPKLSKEWHPTKNEGLTPQDLTAGSSRKVWWRCATNPEHEWEAVVRNRAIQKKGCPFCGHHKASNENSLANTYPELADQWHLDKNGTLTPQQVSYGSAKRVWWQCDKNVSHQWQATVTSRTHSKNPGCPMCKGRRTVSDNSLATLFPGIAKEWHPIKNVHLTPDDVTKASGQKVWWQCAKSPDHEWEAQIKNRTVLKSGCPICAREWGIYRIQNALIESVNLNTDYFKTFVLNINNLRKLAVHPVDEKRLQQPFLRMIFSSAVTCMETYLSDAFYHLTIPHPDLVKKLLLSDPEFSEKKYSVKDLIAWRQNETDEIEKYLFSIVWHNLAKVRMLYRNVLGINFPEDMDGVYRAISVRHDLVHRNGKTKSGLFHRLQASHLDELFKDVHDFVACLDSQAGAIKEQI